MDSASTNATLSWGTWFVVSLVIAGIAYAIYSTWKNAKTVPAHAMVLASTAKLLLVALSFTAALAIDNAAQSSFAELGNDFPWIKTGGPWIYAGTIVTVVVVASIGLSGYINNVTNVYGNNAIVVDTSMI